MSIHPRRELHGCRDFRRSHMFQRRQILQAGTLSALGLGWGDVLSRAALAGQGTEQGSSFQNGASAKPRAKACILLFMWGGPSQLETFDLKPDAPAEVLKRVVTVLSPPVTRFSTRQ